MPIVDKIQIEKKSDSICSWLSVSLHSELVFYKFCYILSAVPQLFPVAN